MDAARLGSAFLVAPATMSQRLVRAKSRMATAGIPFAVPEPEHLSERLADVLEAIYAAFGISWSEVVHGTERWMERAEEAIWLARVLTTLLPDAAEAREVLRSTPAAVLREALRMRAARIEAV